MYNLLVIICFCIAAAAIDLKTYRIPDSLLIVFAVVIIFLDRNLPLVHLVLKFSAAILSFSLYFAVWYFSKGIGFGDVKYAFVLGFALGIENTAYSFIITAFLCLFIYLTGIVVFRWPKNLKIPFAPFISAGAIMSIYHNFINYKFTGGII